MNQNAHEQSLPVGDRIKRFRVGAGLSLDDLSARTGLQAEELERIEKNMISPALGILTKICGGLGIRLGHFFQQGPRKFYSVVRAEEEEVATRFADKDGVDHGYVYRSLGWEKRKQTMDPFLVTLTPPSAPDGKKIEPEKPLSHDGEEFLYILAGQIEVQLQGQDIVMNPGDSIYFDASMSHRVIHIGDIPAKVLLVFNLPQSGDKDIP